MLVHGADAMGGSSSPDGIRGFGRVLLEGSLPVGGEGSTTMYFDDSAVALAGMTTNYVVTVSRRNAQRFFSIGTDVKVGGPRNHCCIY